MEESNYTTRAHMVNYFINRLDNSGDFSWQSAKARDTIVLCRMDLWEKHYQIFRANAQNPIFPGRQNLYQNKEKTSGSTYKKTG